MVRWMMMDAEVLATNNMEFEQGFGVTADVP